MNRILALLVLAAAPLAAQNAAPRLELPSASPAAVIKQKVGITDIEISYSRPSVRGREIFGELVPYGEVWRTGANAATRISFGTPVTLNGRNVPAGDYELFTIPGKDEWTFIIHQAKSQWGAYSYDPANDVARVVAQPEETTRPVETFTLAFEDIDTDSATLALTWDRVRVPVTIEVDTRGALIPRIEAVMASDSARKPYAQAALFYLNQGLDLAKAAAWMDAAIAQDPDAFYLVYQKARILAKMGDTEGARAAAQTSLEAARKSTGPIRDEYIRLNEALLATL